MMFFQDHRNVAQIHCSRPKHSPLQNSSFFFFFIPSLSVVSWVAGQAVKKAKAEKSSRNFSARKLEASEDKGACVTRACPLYRRNLCYSTRQPRTGSSLLHLGEHSLFCNQGLSRSILREERRRPLVAPRSPSAGSGTEWSYGTSAVRYWFPGEEGREGPWRRGSLGFLGGHGYYCWKAAALPAQPGRRGPLEWVFALPAWEDNLRCRIGEREGTRAREALAGLLGSSPSLLQTSPSPLGSESLCLPGQVSCFEVWKKSPAFLVPDVDSLGMGFPFSWNFLVLSQILSNFNVASFPPNLV